MTKIIKDRNGDLEKLKILIVPKMSSRNCRSWEMENFNGSNCATKIITDLTYD